MNRRKFLNLVGTIALVTAVRGISSDSVLTTELEQPSLLDYMKTLEQYIYEHVSEHGLTPSGWVEHIQNKTDDGECMEEKIDKILMRLTRE